MFLGTTTGPVRDYMATELCRSKPRKLYEPFAGIFMVSQICGMIDKSIEVHSTEVSLYSVAIGGGLTDQDFGIGFTDYALNCIPSLEKLKTPIQLGAAVIFLSEYAEAERKRNIGYYDRLRKDMENGFDAYIEKICLLMKKARGNLGDFHFHAQDAVERLKNVEKGDVVFFDPPFWTEGYEKMFKDMARMMTWEPVPYTIIDDAKKIDYLKHLDELGAKVYFRPENKMEIDGYNLVFDCEHKLDGHYLVYSNDPESKRMIQKKERFREKVKRYDMAFKDDVFTSKSRVEIIKVNSAESNHFRMLWTRKVGRAMKSTGIPFLVMVDKKVIGVISIGSGETFGMSYALIVADAATTYTKYRKLSKAILLMILSDEFVHRINEMTMWEHEGFTTVAYSDQPVSMKYRGLFQLAKKETKHEGDSAYKLTYRTKNIRFKTIKQAWKSWMDKHGRDTK